jgi:hypothetical protein
VLPLVAQHEVEVSESECGKGLLRLHLDQLAAESGCVARERLHGRQRQVHRYRLEPGDAATAGDGAGGRSQVGLRRRRALQQGLGVVDQD